MARDPVTTGAEMPRRLPQFCCEDTDRHGNHRVYLRRPGFKKVRLHGTPWTPEFMATYTEALTGVPAAPRPAATSRNTWGWLCEQYFASPAFKSLADTTQRVRQQILEATFTELTDGGRPFVDCPIGYIDKSVVRGLRDRKSDLPGAANNRVKAIRAVFVYAVEYLSDQIQDNPARDVSLFRQVGDGFHTWTIPEVEQYQARHPIGSMARRALALLLYTGVRRCDVVTFGKQMVREGALHFQPRKTKRSSGVKLHLPILPVLRTELGHAPADRLTYLFNRYGKSFSAAGFGNAFKEWCYEADLPHCSAHGLRKAGATIAAENGASDAQLMAIFGWATAKMAAHYRKGADQTRLAREAMHLISLDQNPTHKSGGTKRRKEQ